MEKSLHLRGCYLPPLNLFAAFGVLALLAGLAGCGSNSSVIVTGANAAGGFNFGNVALSTQVRRLVLTVSNTTSSTVTLSPAISGGTGFTIAANVSCGTSLPAGAACSEIILFSPTAAGAQNATLDLGMSSNDQTVPLSGNGVQLAPGQSIVANTDNPLVARYTYTPQYDGSLAIQFGPDTTYGLQTSAQTVTAGTPVSFLVAGMTGNSTYHMQAVLTASSGATVTDVDHTFTTSNFTADEVPSITVSSTGTPQPGVEFMNPASAPGNTTYLQAYAVDLQGNVIWGYQYPDRQDLSVINPFKLLANGDMLVLIGINSQTVTGPPPANELVVLREIDLAGVPVRQITLAQLNTALAAANFPVTLYDFHHDVEVLPNGHWVVIGNTIKSLTGLPGTTGATNVLGDVLVDLDTNLNPVWVWSEFDNLSPSRAPAGYPDWTHTNAVIYDPSDGNLLVSSRHQSWLMKVNYNNGAGAGNILWRLGYQGDFTLTNGTQPQDWFFGQHQPSIVSSTAGNLTLALMDNGFTRQSPAGTCTGAPGAACYTTVPILQVNETAKTATISWRDSFPPADFSVWGGSTTPLANGDLEFDLTNEPNTTSNVMEVTITNPPTTVWSLTTTGQNLYRANRMPSLYPGVQW